jgi:hypothetical protein
VFAPSNPDMFFDGLLDSSLILNDDVDVIYIYNSKIIIIFIENFT